MEAVEDTSEKSQGPIVKKLEAAIGAENVKTSKMERLLYSHDLALPAQGAQTWRSRSSRTYVVRPRSTEDVSEDREDRGRGRVFR